MDAPKLLRVPEVAKVFNVSRPTVYRMVAAGELEAYSIGGSVRIPAAAVDAYLRSNRLGPGTGEPITVGNALSTGAGAKAAEKRPPKRTKGVYAPTRPTAAQAAERKAWRIARRMAVKLVAADATDVQWDEALQKAYVEARKRLSPKPVHA